MVIEGEQSPEQNPAYRPTLRALDHGAEGDLNGSMKILVTGGAGFIGSHLVKRLKREGYWVRGVDLKYPEFARTHADDFFVGDFRDPATGIAGIDVRNAMRRLGPDDRALIAMRYVAGFNATELADAIGLSPSGTRARLARLLERLRQDLSHG